MLYRIHCRHRIDYQGGQAPIIHLVTSVEAIASGGFCYVYTDGHAIMNPSSFFNDLQSIDSNIDWSVMRSRYWNDTNDDPDRKRRRQAEFLVHEFVPWDVIHQVGVYNQGIREQVLRTCSGKTGHLPEVSVEPGWYY